MEADRKLNDIEKRTLAEAEERRSLEPKAKTAKEIGGRDGPDPVRFGDWEKNGLTSDY